MQVTDEAPELRLPLLESLCVHPANPTLDTVSRNPRYETTFRKSHTRIRIPQNTQEKPQSLVQSVSQTRVLAFDFAV